MKTNISLKKARELLSKTKVEIRPFRSTKRYAGANYLVRLKSGLPQTMRDGTHWEGYEHVGHFARASDAIAAAFEVADIGIEEAELAANPEFIGACEADRNGTTTYHPLSSL